MDKSTTRKKFVIVWGNSNEIRTTAHIKDGRIISISERLNDGYHTFVGENNKGFKNEIRWFVNLAYEKYDKEKYDDFIKSLSEDFLNLHFKKVYLPR